MINYYLLIVCGLSCLATCEESMLCKQCGEPTTTSHVREFCESNNATGGLLLSGCCCVNTTSETPWIIGLDLSDCHLKSITGLLELQTALGILMLDNNTDLTTRDEDFRGLTQLLYLSLPGNTSCPGGNTSWSSVSKGDNFVICHDELDICLARNLTCPNNNSHCVLSGPGEADCLCNDGFHGYKCLRQGHFPYIYYTAVLCSTTVAISAFLWFTQRRKVKKIHVH